MITKYYVPRKRDEIEEVEVLRETDKSVWVPDACRKHKIRRANKRSNEWGNYFDTWKEARDFCLDHWEAELQKARSETAHAEAAIDVIKALKAPEPPKLPKPREDRKPQEMNTAMPNRG